MNPLHPSQITDEVSTPSTSECDFTVKYVFFFKCLLKKTEVQLIYNVVPVSAAQQNYSVINIYIHIILYILFHYGLSQDMNIVPCAIRTLLFTHSKCNSLHLPTPNSQSIALPPSSPLEITNLFSIFFMLFKKLKYS